jgi:hypothetical protein
MVNGIRLLGCLALVGLLLCGTGLTPGQGEKPGAAKTAPADSDKPASAKPATHKVTRKPFKIEVSCKGSFEAGAMTEVSLDPEEWHPQGGGALSVLKAVEHGTPVRKGDVLASLVLTQIDRTIRDLEADRALTEVSIQQTEKELAALEKVTPLDLAAAERAKLLADEDLSRFLDGDRAQEEKMVNYQVKSMSQFLEYAKEELKQLEKMYRRKDLTEETEEIILKRQRNMVEMVAHYLAMAEYYRDQTLKVELPRKEHRLKESAEKLGLDREKARATLPLNLQQKQLSLKKLRYEQEKTAARLARLQKDRENMTVKSPADGIAYHGRCVRGKWDPAAMSSKLVAGGQLMPHEVLITVVQARPLFVRAVVEEKDLPHVRPGVSARVVSVVDPDHKLTARIDKVSTVPITPGHFEAWLTLDLSREAASLMPGMACTVKLVPYAKNDALVVPARAVFTDELDDDHHHVFLAGKDGKHERRAVVLGKKNADHIEIRNGLQEGDEILKEDPTADKDSGGKTAKEGE